MAVIGLAVVVPAVMGAGAAQITGDPTSPLTIDISADLNCTVNYAGDNADEWFTEDTGVDACGTFVALPNSDGPTAVFGPADVPGATCLVSPSDCNIGSWRYESYSFAQQEDGDPNNQVTGGTGTQADPYTITTTVTLGATDLQLVETDSYVNGQNSYRTDIKLINTGQNGLTYHPVIYHAGDCFLQNQDNGLGSVQDGNAPVCNGAPTQPVEGVGARDRASGLRPIAADAAPDPTTRIEGMYPIGSGSSYLEGYFDCIWQAIGSGTAFPNQQDVGAVTQADDTCQPEDPMGNPYDNGLGVSWSPTIAPGDSTTVSTLNVFSPGGAAPLTVSKTADKASVPVGGTDGYTITISNPGDQPETLDDITDTLPATFSYVADSSTGASTDNPAITGHDLEWPGTYTVPAATGTDPGTLTLHFGVTVGNTTGIFRNSASASGTDLTVEPVQGTAPVDVTPKAVDDGVYTTPYETAKTVAAASGLLANDLPNDGTTSVVTDSIVGPSHGTVAVNTDGSFTYTPTNGYSGPDSFTYHDVSHRENSNTATVSLTVSPPPAPVAMNDAYSTPYETVLSKGAANGLLQNDQSSAPDQALTVDTTTVSHPVHGTVSVASDGSFTYTPTNGYTGMDSFTYKDLSDGQHSNQATVTITVGPSPAPIAADDTYTTPYETVLTVTNPSANLLTNDTPPKDQTNAVDTTSIVGPSHGTVTVQADGNFTYTPNNGYTGMDSFTYQDIANGVKSNVATVSITVGQFAPPVANNDVYTTPFGTALTVGSGAGLLNNDTGPAHQNLSVETSSVSVPGHGSATVNADGSFTYTPNSGFTGTDTFTYKDIAGGVESNQATVSVTVGADPRPTAVDDGPYAVNRNGNLHVDATPNGVLVNDTDPNDLALTAVQPTSPSHGTVTLQADGSFTYTPNNGYVGPDSFTYKARNSNGDTSATAATVSFNVIDQAPTAVPDSYSTPQNTVLNEPAPGVLANDTDPNGDPLTAHLVDAASHGAVTLNADGSFTYSPVAGFHGSDTFTYTASDGTLSSAATTVTIDVTPPPPNAEDDAYQVDKNSALHVTAADGVLSNDTPNDGSLTVHLNNDASHGSLTLNADGSFDYTPDHGFSGTDTFTYHDTAGEQSSDAATVTITVVDQAPVASPNSYNTGHDTTLTVPANGVLGNDTDSNGDSLTAAIVTSAHHGAVTLNADGSFTYSPAAGFHGTDTFTYQASDGTLSSNTATVTIHVSAAAPPPPPPSSPTPPPPSSSTPAPPPPPVSTTPAVVTTPPVQPTTPQDTFPPPPTSVPPPPPTSAPPTSSPPPVPRHASLRLSSPSVIPGGQLTATGTGCQPNQAVTVTVAGRAAGNGTADGSGNFAVPVSAPNLGVGNFQVVATCGSRQLTTEVALVYVVGTSATPAARSLTVASLLAFFILLLGLIIRRPSGSK